MIRTEPHDKCNGCNKIGEDGYCTRYSQPSAWFRGGRQCPFTPGLRESFQKPHEKVRVGQKKTKRKNK